MNMLGERLRTLRIQKDITQEAVAKLFGVDRSTVASWEIGRREPNFTTILRLTELYDSSLDYIFGLISDPEHVTSNKISSIPSDLLQFINNKENQDLIGVIQQMQTNGYPSKVILDWISSLKNTFETMKLRHDFDQPDQVLWVDEDLLTDEFRGKYTEEQKKDIADRLKVEFKKSDFSPPWKNNCK